MTIEREQAWEPGLAAANGDAAAIISSIEDQNEALLLWARGLSYREVAAELGCAVSTAYYRVTKALEAMRPHEEVGLYRAIQRSELEMARRVLRKVISDEEVPTSQRIAAIGKLVALQAHEARLLGLDAYPLVYEEVSIDDLEAKLDAYISRSNIDWDAVMQAYHAATGQGGSAAH